MGSRDTTVLFADVTGSTRLYEAAGDAQAVAAIAICLQAVRAAAESAGGRVVKTMGDEVMALFATPDQAADAAARMHHAVETLPPVDGHKLALRIGFHAGPVVQRDNDVFGDTVNLASRLADQATKGQVLTSADTVALMHPFMRNSTRRLYDIPVKGKAGEIALCELLWSKSPEITNFPVGRTTPKPGRVSLRLKYRDQVLVRRRLGESLTIGREPGCTLVVGDPAASRQHCVIERRQDRFFLKDHSSNGTYLSIEGEGETILRREEIALRGHGWIAFGQPKELAVDLVEYFCE